MSLDQVHHNSKVLPRSHFVMNFDGFGSHPSQFHAIYQGLGLGSILWWVWIKSITNPCYILGLGLGSMLWWTASYHWFLMNLSQIVLSLNFSVHAFAGIYPFQDHAFWGLSCSCFFWCQDPSIEGNFKMGWHKFTPYFRPGPKRTLPIILPFILGPT